MAARLPALAASDGHRVEGVSALHPPRPSQTLPVRRLGLPSRPLMAGWQFLRRPRLWGYEAVLSPSLAVPAPGRARLVVFCADVAFLRVPEAYTPWGVLFHQRGLANPRREAAVVLTCSQAAAHHPTPIRRVDPNAGRGH